mmetsp:Transcript_24984/g.53985  ORF Transcript_24984/g.53985 Transcript_24984/m.53985 type:complete len:226 (+) Transcript_24984:501-1178(+)
MVDSNSATDAQHLGPADVSSAKLLSGHLTWAAGAERECDTRACDNDAAARAQLVDASPGDRSSHDQLCVRTGAGHRRSASTKGPAQAGDGALNRTCGDTSSGSAARRDDDERARLLAVTSVVAPVGRREQGEANGGPTDSVEDQPANLTQAQAASGDISDRLYSGRAELRSRYAEPRSLGGISPVLGSMASTRLRGGSRGPSGDLGTCGNAAEHAGSPGVGRVLG